MNIEPPSLLITDDDPGFRETLREAFQPRGFRTLLAGDGEEALDIVRSRKVHLLLLDLYMPKLTGLETLQRVKQFKALMPCILMSGRLDERVIEQAHRARVFTILEKPFPLDTLTSVVRKALQRTYNWPG